MDNKQTAVQWLIENAEDFLGGLLAPSITEKALQMERKQIEEAYMDSTLQFDNASPIINPKTPSEYYNQTYTQNNNQLNN